MDGQPTAATACCHLLGMGAQLLTSEGQPAPPRIKYHGISLGPAQTLFSYELGSLLTHYPVQSLWDLTWL